MNKKKTTLRTIQKPKMTTRKLIKKLKKPNKSQIQYPNQTYKQKVQILPTIINVEVGKIFDFTYISLTIYLNFSIKLYRYI